MRGERRKDQSRVAQYVLDLVREQRGKDVARKRISKNDDRLKYAEAGIREQDASDALAKANEEGASDGERKRINEAMAQAKEDKYAARPAIKPAAFIEDERMAAEGAEDPEPVKASEHEGPVFEGVNSSPHTIDGRPVIDDSDDEKGKSDK